MSNSAKRKEDSSWIFQRQDNVRTIYWSDKVQDWVTFYPDTESFLDSL